MGRRKDVLLLVLAVTALGVAVYTFRGKPAAPSAATPAPTALPKSQKRDAKAKENGKGGALPSASLPGGGTRNPFEGPGVTAAAPAAARTAPAAPEKPSGQQTQTPAPAVNPFPVQPRPTTPAATGPKTKPAAQTLALYGIVAGKQAMAVIREGDQRYYVKAGDRIGDRYRVQTISQREVVLVGSEGKVILRMGGRQ